MCGGGRRAREWGGMRADEERFQVPSGVVVFDTVVDGVISRGVKTLLLFNVHNDFAGFSEDNMLKYVSKNRSKLLLVKTPPKMYFSNLQDDMKFAKVEFIC